MQSVAEIKSSLHSLIAETHDVSVLSNIQEYMKELLNKEDKVIAYTAEGKPLTQSDYKKSIDEARASVEKGGFFTQEEVGNDDSWLKEK